MITLKEKLACAIDDPNGSETVESTVDDVLRVFAEWLESSVPVDGDGMASVENIVHNIRPLPATVEIDRNDLKMIIARLPGRRMFTSGANDFTAALQRLYESAPDVLLGSEVAEYLPAKVTRRRVRSRYSDYDPDEDGYEADSLEDEDDE